MKKNVIAGNKTKAIIASAMALTLAVPSVVMMNHTTPVQADESIPDPVAVYNFEDLSQEKVTLVDNGTAPSVVDDAGRNGKVLSLGSTIVTPEVVAIVTEAATDASGNAVEVTKEAVLKETEYSFSEAKIENPFKGRTDLLEEPQFPNKNNPYWENGVTISYWQKATDTDSSVISFSNRRENILQKDVRDKEKIFNLYEADPDNEMFSLGTQEEFEWKRNAKYNGKRVTSGLPKTTYSISVGCGMFVRFNPNYTGNGYYMKLSGDGQSYELLEIGSPFNKEDYMAPTGKEAVYGTAEGGLQLNSSGEWGYIESGATQWYKAGAEVSGKYESLCNGNMVGAHTFTVTGKEKTPVDAALTKKPAEWHYVTRVIKNDSVSTYIDGVLKDSELYTNGWDENLGNVDVKKGFNLGWGYYSSADEENPMIVMPGSGGGKTIFDNASSIAIANAQGKFTVDGVLGYNGNTNGMTIMEMLVNENTTLSFGGQSLGIKSIMNYYTETQAGTALDNVAFYDRPLDSAQIAALYEQAKAGDIVVPSPSPSQEPEVSQEPGASQEPKVSQNPSVSEEPEASKSPITGPAVSAEPVESQNPVTGPGVSETPNPGPSDVKLGDIDGDGNVALTDAQMALKGALRIEELKGTQLEAADVNKSGTVDLEDAQMILKEALRITTDFK